MKKLSIFLSDIAILYISLILTVLIRYPNNFKEEYWRHLYPFSLIFISWLLVFYIANLYEPKLLRNNVNFYSALFQVIIIAAAISVLFFYLIPLYGITPKTNLLIFLIIFTGLEFANRSLSNNILQKSFRKSILIVGANSQSLELDFFIKENPQLGYEIKSVIDITSDKFKDIGQTIQEEKIDTIVLSPEAYQVPEIIDIFYKSLEQKVGFMNLASFYELLTGMVPLGAINQIWFLENLNEGNKRAYEIVKRGSDLVFVVIIGLISLLFYPFIILLIKTTSEGPVFYKQRRVGQTGKIFEIIKFRTMNKDAEKETGAVWASNNDPRITKAGGFMRKTRIDELPQLWNIFKGQMAFIGPRAERPEFNEQLKTVPFYEERYLIKPGLSGWAQINFRYGSSVADAAEKLKYDLYYIKNRSLILDLGIALKTIRIMFQRSGK
jgi:exopolysaccharide biosynthesis polyprenyl glycosylphosphotransferase